MIPSDSMLRSAPAILALLLAACDRTTSSFWCNEEETPRYRECVAETEVECRHPRFHKGERPCFEVKVAHCFNLPTQTVCTPTREECEAWRAESVEAFVSPCVEMRPYEYRHLRKP